MIKIIKIKIINIFKKKIILYLFLFIIKNRIFIKSNLKSIF